MKMHHCPAVAAKRGIAVTALRGMRLYVASLHDDSAAIDRTLDEVANCAVCLRALLHMQLAMLATNAVTMRGGNKSAAIAVADNLLQKYAGDAAKFTYDGVAPSPPQPVAAPAPTNWGTITPPGMTSIPVWTVEVCGVYFTIILVNVPGTRQQHQIYAVDQGRDWVMVGLVGLYVDALAEIQSWRAYLSGGGTLASWKRAHPDGIEPLFRR
jgi:hypothetical protein